MSPLSHLIAFTSLLILTFVSLMFARDIYVVNLSRVKVRLAEEVAQSIAGDLVDLIRSALTSDSENLVIVKELQIPSAILNRAYTVTMSVEGSFFAVRVSVDGLSSESEVPLNASGLNITVELGGESFEFRGYVVRVSNTILSGAERPIIWAVKNGNRVRVGLGVMED